MTEYKVIKAFTDLKDDNHVYQAGDDFPREGSNADEKRIAELSGTENKRKEALIAAVTDEGALEKVETDSDEVAEVTSTRYPKHNGGGWYELSNGETVQGKDAALEAEAKLQE